MVNLLGEKNYEGPAKYEGLIDAMKFKGVYIHLYGKKNTTPFRKMGHITVVDDDLNLAKKKAIIVKDLIKIIS
jgi:5-(carboxyamino)imidazole ribonucleotide synthase